MEEDGTLPHHCAQCVPSQVSRRTKRAHWCRHYHQHADGLTCFASPTLSAPLPLRICSSCLNYKPSTPSIEKLPLPALYYTSLAGDLDHSSGLLSRVSLMLSRQAWLVYQC